MGRAIWVGAAALLLGAAPPPARPAITGISHVAIYAADMAASDRFYTVTVGARRAADPEDAAGVRYHVNARQFVEVLPLPPGLDRRRLPHVAFATSDAARLRRYLVAQGQEGLSPLHRDAGGRWFETEDPEGNRVQFVQAAQTGGTAAPDAIGGRMIHLGFVVRDRAKQDRFYRELLGFRPYWHGAMQEGATDWVSQQVPDGRDWLEYMLVGPGSTVSPGALDANLLGVLDHLSLGVPNMEAAFTTLHAGDRLPPRNDGPKIGRDGKWQVNLYDPDGTRVELMEFAAVAKPCCSPFTAPDPRR